MIGCCVHIGISVEVLLASRQQLVLSGGMVVLPSVVLSCAGSQIPICNVYWQMNTAEYPDVMVVLVHHLRTFFRS